MTMRVLHLIASLGPGGAERQVSLLLPQLQRAGIATTLCCHTTGPNLQPLIDGAVAVDVLPRMANHDPRLLFHIWRVASAVRPHIIQTWLPQMDVLGGVIARQLGVAHILSERSSSEMYASGGWKNRFRVAVGRRAKAIIANSEGGLEYWRARGALGSMYVVRNAPTPPSSKCGSLSLPGFNGEKLLLAAGRLSHEKNIPILVKAIAAALAKLPSHHAVIFGDGPERATTAAMIADTGLSDRFHLGGYTQQLSRWMEVADVFVSASLMEGHPNVVIEAAAAGCPMVLSDIPAHREFAVAGSALFAPVTDPNRLADAIVQSVNDRAASLTRAAQARLLVDALSVEAAAQKLATIYSNLLNERSQL